MQNRREEMLSMALYRTGKSADVKQRWNFIIDQIRDTGYGQAAEDPLSILKISFAKGEIDQAEYEKLCQTIAA